MVVQSAKTGLVDVTLQARVKANVLPPRLLNVPGGLYPMMSSAWEVDEYRIMAGWPVPVPDGDIRAEVLVSGDGTVLGNRDAPTSLTTNAAVRWCADTNYYDQTALQWTPIQGQSSPWQTNPDNEPTLYTDYEYRINDERFIDMTVLNFDSDTAGYMTCNLDLVMGGTSGYTVIMVLSPNSLYGNDPNTIENGLWGPDTLDGAYAYFTVKVQAIFMTTDKMRSQKGVPIGDALSSTAPTYVALVVDRPQTVLYAGPGPSKILSKSLVAGPTPEPLGTHFWLGNTPNPEAGTMDMALLDLGIYPNTLKRSAVMAEFSLLSQVYGGDG